MGLIQSVVLYVFIIAGIALATSPFFIKDSSLVGPNSGSSTSDPVLNESFFKKIKYHTLKSGKKSLFLDAANLTSNRASLKTIFFNPEGTVLTKSGQLVDYKSVKGEFISSSEYLKLEGNVELSTFDSSVDADKVNFYGDKDIINCFGNVLTRTYSESDGDNIEVRSDKVKILTDKNRSIFNGNVVGEIKRKRVYEENINFKSDIMKLHMDKNIAYLFDNVLIKKQSLKAYSRRGEIYLENYNKKLKYFALYDDVRVVEKVTPNRENGFKKAFVRKSFSEKLEGITSEAKIILSGYPKVLQHGDVIKGNLIVLREDIDVIEVIDANTNFKVGN